jgi:hypothetical protein
MQSMHAWGLNGVNERYEKKTSTGMQRILLTLASRTASVSELLDLLDQIL